MLELIKNKVDNRTIHVRYWFPDFFVFYETYTFINSTLVKSDMNLHVTEVIF